MTDLQRLEKLIQQSLNSDCRHEQRFALVMGRIVAMREAIKLEHDIEHEPMAAALLDSGVGAMDACLEILSMYWGKPREDQ